MDKVSQKTKVIQFLKDFRAFIDKSPLWRIKYSNLLYAMEDKINEPCVLAIAGRVKAGKSSFLNALLGKKLAVVGINETTATINMFRKRTSSDDPSHEIKIIWENGSVSYEDYSFMDKLQGTSIDVLNLAKQIRRVEYITDDELLDRITLVDTPGTDAQSGDGDTSHEKTVEEYLLRKKHTSETLYYTDTADAIIYLTGMVANQSNEHFLQEFSTTTGRTSSALNSIGILARADELPFSERKKLPQLVCDVQNGLKDYLNVVMPVSSCLWDVINRQDFDDIVRDLCNRLSKMASESIDFVTNRLENFLRDDEGDTGIVSYMNRKGINSDDLSIFEIDYRKSLYDYFEHWTITKLIIDFAVECNFDVNTTKQKLFNYAGIGYVKDKVYEHFFNRAESIKCFRIMSDLKAIIDEINRFGLSSLKIVAKQKKEVLERINTLPRETYDWILSNYKMIPPLEKLEELEKEFNESILVAYDELISDLQWEDNIYEASIILTKHRELFTADERDELENLFNVRNINKSTPLNARERFMYWNEEMITTKFRERKVVAQMATSVYSRY